MTINITIKYPITHPREKQYENKTWDQGFRLEVKEIKMALTVNIEYTITFTHLLANTVMFLKN